MMRLIKNQALMSLKENFISNEESYLNKYRRPSFII